MFSSSEHSSGQFDDILSDDDLPEVSKWDFFSLLLYFLNVLADGRHRIFSDILTPKGKVKANDSGSSQ